MQGNKMHKCNRLYQSTTSKNWAKLLFFLQDLLRVFNVLHQFDLNIGWSLIVCITNGTKNQRKAK